MSSSEEQSEGWGGLGEGAASGPSQEPGEPIRPEGKGPLGRDQPRKVRACQTAIHQESPEHMVHESW